MANNSHFPAIEGKIRILNKGGKVTKEYDLRKDSGYAEITAEVHDKNGNLKSSQTFPMKSFVKNMAYALLANFEALATSTDAPAIATDNTVGLIKEFTAVASSSDDSYGLVVGSNGDESGYNPSIGKTVSTEDYGLRFQFAEGTSTNQLTHGATTIAYTNGNGDMSISRTFTNSTGSSLTIGEIGVQISNGTKEYLIARDVDTSVDFPNDPTGTQTAIGITMADTTTLTLTYKFKITDADGLLNGWLGYVASKLTGAAQTVPTCQVNTSVSSASVDFHTNPAYASWKAIAGVEDIGLLVGSGTASTSRNEFALLNIDQTLTHAAQEAGTVSAPVGGYDLVKNNNGSWKVYKVYVGTTRRFTNATGSSITLKEAAIALTGSASTARIPIVRFRLPSDIVLNDTETLELDLNISMVSNVSELLASGS